MANIYSVETTGVLDGTAPSSKADGRIYQAKVRRIRATFTMAAQATTDTLVLGKLPIGAVFAGIRMTASATAGASATIAVGIAGATAKYRAAAVFTAVDTPTMYGPAAAMAQAPLAAEETVIATIAVAALAAAGTLVFEIFYTTTAS